MTPAPTAVTTPAKSAPSCWQPALETRVPTERDEDVGEVQVGRRDRHLDLTRPGWDTGVGRQLGGLKVAGRADLQAHAVVLGLDDDGPSLVGLQRGQVEPGGVPLAVSPCGLVLVGTSQQLRGHQPASVSRRRRSGWPPVRMLHADHPHQPAQAAMLQVGDVTRTHRLGVARDHVQPRRLARRSPAAHARCARGVGPVRRPPRGLGIGLAITWRGDDDDAAERGGGELRPQAARHWLRDPRAAARPWWRPEPP